MSHSATLHTKKSRGFRSGELWGHTYPKRVRNLVKIFKKFQNFNFFDFIEPLRLPLDGSKSTKLIENSSKGLN